MSTKPRFVQLVASCMVLGAGVALLLLASLGSDGYSTLINGIAISSTLPFVVVNCGVGVVLVGLGWWRGLAPGWGTVVQPIVVGATITELLALAGSPHALIPRIALLVVAFPVLAVGVAGYLASGAGAGPSEAAALAFDPPLPFRWSYSALQAGVRWSAGCSVPRSGRARFS